MSLDILLKGFEHCLTKASTTEINICLLLTKPAMLPTSPLDTVIKKIDENTQISQLSNSSTQKIVITDVQGKILPRKPIWGGSFLFLVSTKNVAEFSIPGFEISRKFVYGTESGGDYFDVFEH